MDTQPLSLLRGEEIKSLGLVEGSTDDNLYRPSTYDLSVGEIIPAKSVAAGSTYNLPPGGTVMVVSKETLKLPNNITGHALLKNALCRQGVLAINIGVVDPCFEGPISSILTNFGRSDFPVKQGDSFMRISFLRCQPSAMAKEVKYDRSQYISRAKVEMAAYMDPSFLNVDAKAEGAAKKAFDSFTSNLVIWASMAALVLALLAIYSPLGASNMDRYFAAREKHELQLEQTIERKLDEQYAARLKTLTDQVEELKRSAANKVGPAKTSGGKR